MSYQLNTDGQENAVSSQQIQNNPISRNVGLQIKKRKQGIDDLVEHELINTSQDKSTMLKSQTSAAFHQQLLPITHASTSAYNYLPDTNTVDMQSTASAIPKKPKAVTKKNEDKKGRTCISPIQMTSASKTTQKPRRGSIDEINMEIIEEKLKQEMIMTTPSTLRLHRVTRLDGNFLS
ncbi:uncharacterized protein LOC132933355 [Metopolophium dirhodum]|uniref:uncharacterized protein LOC132933355 n=1 Tax=Metopolophium dirhodum TaxID=44670 RepID=UPI00299031FD|nr:uncharacterized protein LOC132933355 [Metopolophium dirhodum]